MTLLDILLKSSLLLVVGSAAIGLVRRGAASQRHFMWMLLLAGLLALPALSALSPWKLNVIPCVVRSASCVGQAPDRTILGVSAASDAPSPAVDPASAAAPSSYARRTTYDAPVAAPARSFSIAAFALSYWWVLGVAILAWRLGTSGFALLRLVRGATPIREDAWWIALDDAATRLRVRNPVRLFESAHARMPMTFGVRRAVIVLPVEAREWTAEQRDVVLLHELAHIKRGDARVNLLGVIVSSLYWFHPMVWSATRRLRIEAERACDDMVLHAGAAPSAYAAQLLTMVQSVLGMRAPALALPLAQRSAFEGRVLAILDRETAREDISLRAMVACITAVGIVALPIAALAPARAEAARGNARTHEPARVAERIRLHTDTVRIVPSPVPAPAVFGSAVAQSPEASPRQAQNTPQDDGSAVAALIGALEDGHQDVRLAAAHALGERGDTVAVDALVNALRRDPSMEVRRAAAWALGQIEDARAVPALIASLNGDRDTELRRQVIWALGQIESKDAVPGLGAALRSEQDPETREKIVWALGQIEDRSAVPFLVPLLRDNSEEIRKQTAWALGQIEDGSAVDGLVAAYRAESSGEVKDMIVWALGQIEDRRAVPVLELALRDSSVEVRRKAAWALSQIEDRSAVPALISAMRDTDVETRKMVIHALGEIGGAEAAQALVAALRDENAEIRAIAARALGNR